MCYGSCVHILLPWCRKESVESCDSEHTVCGYLDSWGGPLMISSKLSTVRNGPAPTMSLPKWFLRKPGCALGGWIYTGYDKDEEMVGSAVGGLQDSATVLEQMYPFPPLVSHFGCQDQHIIMHSVLWLLVITIPWFCIARIRVTFDLGCQKKTLLILI